MWEAIATLFSGYGALAMIIFLIGVTLCVVEVFIPDFGIVGLLGGLFTFAGIIIRFVIDFNILHLVVMVLLVIAIIVIALFIMLFAARHGWLKQLIIENKTTISPNYVKDNNEALGMLGHTGVALTNFAPAGRFVYHGKMYEALSYGEYIERGSKVQIIEVNGTSVFVKKTN